MQSSRGSHTVSIDVRKISPLTGWALKFLNFDQEQAGEKRKVQMQEVEELRDRALNPLKVYKEKVKRYHDKRIVKQNFESGQMVLLCSSRSRLFPGKTQVEVVRSVYNQRRAF